VAPTFTALFDACVLFPFTLRDVLVQLATTNLFRAKWSADIHEEWMHAVRVARPDVAASDLENVRRLMDENVMDAVVEGYQSLVPSLVLPDPKDRHVLAAAIVGRADVIVTNNIVDFPADTLGPLGLEAQQPDAFIMHLVDLSPQAVAAAVGMCRARLRNPPMDRAAYLASLRRNGLTNVAAWLGGLASPSW
jgi:predicted nucleic acid-binding protein